jgi:rod shape-determining protein MreC
MQRPNLRTFLSIFSLIILVIVLHFIGVLNKTEYFLRGILSPVSSRIYAGSIFIKNAETNGRIDLGRELTSTKDALLACQTDTAKFKMLQDENAELRTQLNFFSTQKFVHIGAEVIGRNIEPLGSTLIINRGEKDGVKVGNAVIVSSGVLIGKIAKIEQESSLVRLLNDNQSKVAATILNHEKSLGVIEGGFGISVRMDFIPQQEDVRVGDLIVTSGLEAGMPRGLLVGNVVAIEKEAYEPFQKAILSPAASLSSIAFVSVVTGN